MIGESIVPSLVGKPGRRKAKRILEMEAYRRIAADAAPQTLSELTTQLSAWFNGTYPATPTVSASFIEAAVRETWHRRHEVIGSEL